jgi:hypothetical protein
MALPFWLRTPAWLAILLAGMTLSAVLGWIVWGLLIVRCDSCGQSLLAEAIAENAVLDPDRLLAFLSDCDARRMRGPANVGRHAAAEERVPAHGSVARASLLVAAGLGYLGSLLVSTLVVVVLIRLGWFGEARLSQSPVRSVVFFAAWLPGAVLGGLVSGRLARHRPVQAAALVVMMLLATLSLVILEQGAPEPPLFYVCWAATLIFGTALGCRASVSKGRPLLR